MEVYKLIGKQIHTMRNARNMSQSELSKKIGKSSPGYISFIEAGKRRISIEDLCKLSGIFGVHITSFFMSDSYDEATAFMAGYNQAMEKMQNFILQQ